MERERLQKDMDTLLEKKRWAPEGPGAQGLFDQYEDMSAPAAVEPAVEFHGDVSMVVVGVRHSGDDTIWTVQIRNGNVVHFTDAQMHETPKRMRAVRAYNLKQSEKRNREAASGMIVVNVERQQRDLREPGPSNQQDIETWVVRLSNGTEARFTREQMGETEERRRAMSEYLRVQRMKEWLNPDFSEDE